MAVFPLENASEQAHPVDVEAWTEQTTAAFNTMSITVPAESQETQEASVPLQIPLDEHPAPRPATVRMAVGEGDAGQYRRKEPLRRDSMKRREALLKGKEGSRRRQRWENDRLLANPFAEPPSAKDWEVAPTHPVNNVPYYLAPLWDAGLARKSTERQTAAVKARTATRTVAKKPSEPGVVPKELREKLKKARGAKGLLMDLETEVRAFVERSDGTHAQSWPDEPDSSDDEVVFVGRSAQAAHRNTPVPHGYSKREMMVFETPVEDQSGTFGRWLVHHIGTYYGLRTWSVTRGSVREAYIGLKEPAAKGRISSAICLPPLWGLV